MEVQGWKLPLAKTLGVTKEIKRVKILTGKYKGQIKDFCHFLEGGRVVVHVDVCKNITYKLSSVEFVPSVTLNVTEFY